MNNKKSIILIVSLIIFLAAILCGYKLLKHNKKIINDKPTIVLTKKQKEILVQEGLPDDYNKLTLTQKAGIEAIGDFITYLEKTYPNENFNFEKYYAQTSLYHDEYAEFTCEHGTIKVKRDYKNQEYIYWDDHSVISVIPTYENALYDFMGKYINKDYLKVNTESRKFNELDNDYQSKDILLSVNANNNIMMSEKVSIKEFEKLVNEYSKYITSLKHGHQIYTKFYILDDASFVIINQENYADILLGADPVECVAVSLDSYGEVKIIKDQD